MNKSFKPSGYNSVSPYFVINGAQKLVDLLKELFNASEKRRYDLANGKIMHVELRIDDSIIMIGDASEQFPVYTHLMHVYVKNVDDIFNKAIRLGCESIYSPKRKKETLTREELLRTLQEIPGLLQLNYKVKEFNKRKLR